MNYVVRPKLQLVFAIMALLCVYFPTISHDFSRFDDPFIIEYYGINSTVSFLDVITPGRSFYYRPLVDLSYWLDSRLWGLQPSFMFTAWPWTQRGECHPGISDRLAPSRDFPRKKLAIVERAPVRAPPD